MSEKVIVVHPVLPPAHDGKGSAARMRAPESALAEAAGLARAISLDIALAEIVRLHKIVPGTLFGSGVVDRLKAAAQETGAGLLFVDTQLSPVQQRNLEKALGCKVIDRTGLILEIFGARARTKEGQLQVDLAALSFQRSRLVRAWSHLERQRGGGGFIGGPGETQKELDRRMIDDRIKRLKAELETVRRNRRLQRASRRKEPYPVVALVGYTNAGKSTLFNRLTGAGVLAQDLLFATLDTTMRAVQMPSGQKAVLSDTVGFISDLPTHLVAAFRATLEEVQEAAVILHVRDIAQPDTEAEKQDVQNILSGLGIDAARDPRVIEVWNKIDRLPAAERKAALARAARRKNVAAVSALDGEGIALLCARIDAVLTRHRKTVCVDVDISDGRALAWLYRRGHVVGRADDETQAHIRVALDPADCERFEGQFDYTLRKAT